MGLKHTDTHKPPIYGPTSLLDIKRYFYWYILFSDEMENVTDSETALEVAELLSGTKKNKIGEYNSIFPE